MCYKNSDITRPSRVHMTCMHEYFISFESQIKDIQTFKDRVHGVHDMILIHFIRNTTESACDIVLECVFLRPLEEYL